MPRERFYVEVAPGYVRLRHQLGLRTKFGRGRLGPLLDQVVRQLEDREVAGESIEFERLDPDEEARLLAEEEAERRWNEEAFFDSLEPWEIQETSSPRSLRRPGKRPRHGWVAAPRGCRTGAGGRCGAGSCPCPSTCSATGPSGSR